MYDYMYPHSNGFADTIPATGSGVPQPIVFSMVTDWTKSKDIVTV